MESMGYDTDMKDATEEFFSGEEDSKQDADVKQLMEDHDIDQDTAEAAQELIDTEDLDESDAIELAETM